MLERLLEYVPRGNKLGDSAWLKRHTLLVWVLFVHVPGLFVFGLARGESLVAVAWATVVPLACLGCGHLVNHRRWASFFVTVGLVYSSAALVGLSGGSIEAHFHFFIMVGFIALYQDWVPFLWNIVFTTVSHGVGSALQADLIFNHEAGQANPWLWSAIHGMSVLAACAGVVVFWKANEEEQARTLSLIQRLAETKLAHRQFTSDLLVNLARRNQSLLYRQLDVINHLELEEKDPDKLEGLFRLDHLATRIRRNAESLLVLSGENPPRTWTQPVPLIDVVRAAISETEDLDRVAFHVAEDLAVRGHVVADLAHLLAELVENAARFSPPDTSVDVRARWNARAGEVVLTVEDWGMGMPADELAAANEVLAAPHEIDLSVAQRLGLHVVARLARRHDVAVSLSQTPGGGLTAIVTLPAQLFVPAEDMPLGPLGSGPDPLAAPVPAGPEPPGAVPAGGGPAGGYVSGDGEPLARRVPQAHLAPELRDDWETATPESSRVPGAARARAALSRYQASLNAARADLSGGAARDTNGHGRWPGNGAGR